MLRSTFVLIIVKEIENENLKRCATRSNRNKWTTERRQPLGSEQQNHT